MEAKRKVYGLFGSWGFNTDNPWEHHTPKQEDKDKIYKLKESILVKAVKKEADE